MYEYKGITENYINNFNMQLTKHINEGWQPFGSIANNGDGYRFSILLRRKIKTKIKISNES